VLWIRKALYYAERVEEGHIKSAFAMVRPDIVTSQGRLPRRKEIVPPIMKTLEQILIHRSVPPSLCAAAGGGGAGARVRESWRRGGGRGGIQA
jgi:hypothetical protein